VQQGKRWVADVDLEAFFDRVGHYVLMRRLFSKSRNHRVLGLIRRFLNTEIMMNRS
jgi:retron-type reverse transcriptase